MQAIKATSQERAAAIVVSKTVATPHGSVYEFPTEKCCGVSQLHCWSTKLQASLFVLSCTLLVLYTISSTGALLVLFNIKFKDRKLRRAVVCICVSSILRLLCALSLLIGVLKRTNVFILLYITGNLAALVSYFVGAAYLTTTMVLSALIFIACDIVLLCILRRFMTENHLFTSMLAEKRRRFNRELRIQGNAHSLTETDSNDSETNQEEEDLLSGNGTGSDPGSLKME